MLLNRKKIKINKEIANAGEGCWYLRGDTNMDKKIVTVLNEMSEYLSIAQMKKLQEEWKAVRTELLSITG